MPDDDLRVPGNLPPGMPPNYGVSHDYSTGKVTYGEIPPPTLTPLEGQASPPQQATELPHRPIPEQQGGQQNPAQQGFKKALTSIFQGVEDTADQQHLQYEKEKQGDIAMYQKVLFDPSSSDTQREKAAKEITKLRGLKPKDSPYGGLAGLLNIAGKKLGERKTAPAGGPLGGEVQGPPRSTAARVGGGILKTLGGVANVAGHAAGTVANAEAHKYGRGDVINTSKRMQYPELPPLDPGAFGGAPPGQYEARQNAAITEGKLADAAKALGHPLTEAQKEQMLGLTPKSTVKPLTGTKPYKGPDGRYRQTMLHSDGTITEQLMPEGYTPPPDKMNRDDKYIAIMQKPPQSWSSDERAYAGAYDLWVKRTKTDPGVARAAAFGANRYIPIIDPTNPQGVIVMRAGDAAKAGANTPASIGFQTDKALTKYMVAGKGGENIAYFRTATHHLALLEKVGEALENGDVQAINQVANAFATATGEPAPTSFNAVRNAVAGELAKTFKGTGATNTEIAEINQTINNAQSPAQIKDAVKYYTSLMDGKMQALEAQYEAGKQGRPAFPPKKLPGGPTGSKNPYE